MLSAGIGAVGFYHQAKIEAGGASPNRNFSYYVGLSGYNQDFRYLDNNNGGSLFKLGQHVRLSTTVQLAGVLRRKCFRVLTGHERAR